MKNINVLIGADLVPTKSNYDLFCQGKINEIFDDKLLKIFNNSDFSIFNLETPLIDKSTPIKKWGPNIGIKYNVINGIKKINPGFLNLANNHIMDHGNEGLLSTIKVLNENNISYSGVYYSNSMKHSFIKIVNGFSIGIYSCVEHEFSVASEGNWGANPFDIFESYKHVEELSNKCDFVIVLYHGGKEFYPYPSPDLQKYCRRFIDCGADFVVCQHSHCIGCEETYDNKKIVYGQGNVLFDDGTKNDEWQNGLLLDIEINKHKLININYIVLTRKNNGVLLSEKEISNKLLNDYFDRSKAILKSNFIQEKYSEFAMSKVYDIFRKFDLIGSSFLFRILNKITKKKFGKFYFNKIYLKKKSYEIENAIDCEAWRELTLTYLKFYNLKKQ